MNHVQLSARAAPALPFPGAVRSSDPAAVGMGPYASEVTGVCPYLAPSVRKGQTWWTRLQMPPERAAAGGTQAGALLSAGGLWAAERVRERAAVGDRLTCEVVVVDWAVSRTRQEAAPVLPHWALKCPLAPVGVVCGKFTPAVHGIGDRAEHPESLMVLALRVAVPAKDEALLARTPDLARTVVSAVDDGQAEPPRVR
jgi:hypothetical protein